VLFVLDLIKFDDSMLNFPFLNNQVGTNPNAINAESLCALLSSS